MNTRFHKDYETAAKEVSEYFKLNILPPKEVRDKHKLALQNLRDYLDKHKKYMPIAKYDFDMRNKKTWKFLDVKLNTKGDIYLYSIRNPEFFYKEQ